MKILKILTTGVSKLADPVEEGIHHYHTFVKCTNFPKNFPTDGNPRNANTRTALCKDMAITLVEMDGKFHLLNGGGRTVCKRVIVHPKRNGSQYLELHLEDRGKLKDGLLDGGHTMAVIKEVGDNAAPNQYVQLNIITGVDIETRHKMAETLNISEKVKVHSLTNLVHDYDPIKAVLIGTGYENHVVYQENEEVTGHSIHVSQLIQYMRFMDIRKYDSEKHPLSIYGNKNSLMKEFKNNPTMLDHMIPLLLDILELVEYLHLTAHITHSRAYPKTAIRHSKCYIDKPTKGSPIVLFEDNSKHRLSRTCISVMLAGYRPLLIEKNGVVCWSHGSLERSKGLINKTSGKSLQSIYKTYVRKSQNTDAVVKDLNLWINVYSNIALANMKDFKVLS